MISRHFFAIDDVLFVTPDVVNNSRLLLKNSINNLLRAKPQHPHLHSDLKSAVSINNFKHKIKDNFFKELQKREDSPY